MAKAVNCDKVKRKPGNGRDVRCRVDMFSGISHRSPIGFNDNSNAGCLFAPAWQEKRSLRGIAMPIF
jgi:hypothetical protein